MEAGPMSTVLSCRMSRRALLAGATGLALARVVGPQPAGAATATAIYRGPTDRPVVAITYDCGSDTGYAASILDTLAREGVPCSFGMTGTWADANPGLVQRMVAEGHQLLNHTYNHPSFTGYSHSSGPISSAARKQEIESCESRIIELTGVATRPYFRPPYGDIDDGVLADIGAIGFTACVMWSLDGNGWRGWSQDDIVNRVASNHGNGYIYLFHVGSDSQEGPALPRIIATLRGRGYGFATVAGLLSGSGGTPPPPAAAKFVAGDTVRVTAGLYLRTGPGTGYGVITTMPTGTTCTVVSGPSPANGYTWYQLDTPYGRGWAAGEYLEKTGSAPPPPPPAAKFVAGDTAKVTAGLYLRTGAGFGASVITTMPTGTIVTIVAGPQAANGLTWYQVDSPYGRGWCAGEYLEKTASAPPPPASGFAPGETVKVTAGLYLRTGPGFGTTVITTMPTGTVCTIVSGPQYANNLTWYEVDTPYGRGWAAGEYLTRTSGGTTPPPSGGHAPGTKLKVTAGLYLRTGPGFNTTVITTMPTGTVCTVVSGPQYANNLTWYEVDTPYGRGWAAGEYLEKTGSAPPPPPPSGGHAPGTKLKVTAGLYLRTGPGFNTTVITTMPTGTVCTVVSGPQYANGLTWYEVDTPYGRGWAAGEYMKPV